MRFYLKRLRGNEVESYEQKPLFAGEYAVMRVNQRTSPGIEPRLGA